MRPSEGKLLPTAQRSDLILLPTLLITVLVLVVFLIETVTNDLLILLSVVMITTLQWTLLRRATLQPVPLPGILVVGINLIGVTGYLWYPDLADRAAISAGMPDAEHIYDRASYIFATASVALWVGGMVGWSRQGIRKTDSFRDQAQSAITTLQQANSSWLLAVATAPLVMLIIAYTPTGLWHRDHYSEILGPAWAIKLSGGVTTAGIALTALLASQGSGERRVRTAARLLLATYFVVVFAIGSRSLAFIPLMLLVMFQIDPHPRHRRSFRLFTAVLLSASSLLLLQIPLALRGRPEGSGLEPYWEILTTAPGSLVAWSNAASTLGNILFAVPLAAATSLLPAFPDSYLVTSLNPLPSGYTDWGQIKGDLRINANTPTSALGELANYGTLTLILFFVVFGFVLARVQAWNTRLPRVQATIAVIVGYGAVAVSLLGYSSTTFERGCEESGTSWHCQSCSTCCHVSIGHSAANRVMAA